MGPGGRGAYTAKDQNGIIGNSEHPEEAWEFVKFLVSAEGQRILMETSGLMPIRNSLMPEYLQMMAVRTIAERARASFSGQ